jgi:hypothetical protein
MDGGVAPSLSNRKWKRALGGEFPARIDLQTNSRGDAGKKSYAGQAESESGAKGSHEKRNDDNGDNTSTTLQQASSLSLESVGLHHAEILADAWEDYFQEACREAVGRGGRGGAFGSSTGRLSAAERIRRSLASADLHGARLTILVPGPLNDTARASDCHSGLRTSDRKGKGNGRTRRSALRLKALAGTSGILIGDSARAWTLITTTPPSSSSTGNLDSSSSSANVPRKTEAEGQDVGRVLRVFKAGAIFAVHIRRHGTRKPQLQGNASTLLASSSTGTDRPLKQSRHYEPFTLVGDHWVGRLPGGAGSAGGSNTGLLSMAAGFGQSAMGTPGIATKAAAGAFAAAGGARAACGQVRWHTALEASVEFLAMAGLQQGSAGGSGSSGASMSKDSMVIANRELKKKEKKRFLTVAPSLPGLGNSEAPSRGARRVVRG